MMGKAKDGRHRILQALFAEAKSRGIGMDMLRDEIAPESLGKRLSQAGAQEIARLLDHIKGNTKSEIRNPKF